eukprot:750416-Hanusia_phi.AAC.3
MPMTDHRITSRGGGPVAAALRHCGRSGRAEDRTVRTAAPSLGVRRPGLRRAASDWPGAGSVRDSAGEDRRAAGPARP